MQSVFSTCVAEAEVPPLLSQDKVNISVAIIQMSRDFGWNATVSGFVQSSFFAGYMATQIPGGYVVSKLGGRKVLPSGVTVWSAATAATPLLAGSLPGGIVKETLPLVKRLLSRIISLLPFVACLAVCFACKPAPVLKQSSKGRTSDTTEQKLRI